MTDPTGSTTQTTHACDGHNELDETDSALGGISTSARLDHTAMELWFRSLL